MDPIIRKAQQELLKVFSKSSRTFALSGGTALELYYLHHRFSRDLDFFSPDYSVGEIESLVSEFKQKTGQKVILENEFTAKGRAKVRFYSLAIKGTKLSLKIDFIEDVIFEKPRLRRFDGVPVYDVKQIYFQKVIALTGIYLGRDDTGREIITGRRTARDVFDIYILSKRISPLHIFFKKLPRPQQRGIIQWYHSFSRQELKMELLDFEIHDKKFDASKMLKYIDSEIKKIMGGIVA